MKKKNKSYYDGYDYFKYWDNRDYEHESEVIAIEAFLDSLPQKPTSVADIGCGFGRLLPTYYSKKRTVTLIDPSQDLLDIARKENSNKNVNYICSTVNELRKQKKSQFDLIIMVRVLHHIDDLDDAFSVLNRLLKKNGHIILEFANKMHGKDQIKNFLKGNITYPLDIFPTDKRSSKNVKQGSISFLNHHPDIVESTLVEKGFTILQKRSVSNFRHSFFKEYISRELLLKLEKNSQVPLSHIHFGPSMFVLAKKV